MISTPAHIHSAPQRHYEAVLPPIDAKWNDMRFYAAKQKSKNWNRKTPFSGHFTPLRKNPETKSKKRMKSLEEWSQHKREQGEDRRQGEEQEEGREKERRGERQACVSFLRTTWEQKTRPSSVWWSDSWGMFGCTSNTLSVVAKIEQASKAPQPTAEKRIKSFHEGSAKKCFCYTTHCLASLPGTLLFRHDTGTKGHSKAFVQECYPAVKKKPKNCTLAFFSVKT